MARPISFTRLNPLFGGPTAQKYATVQEVLAMYFFVHAHPNGYRIKTSEIELRVSNWAELKYRLYHNPATYSREFRKLRANPRSPFKIVEVLPRGAEALWEIRLNIQSPTITTLLNTLSAPPPTAAKSAP